MMKFRPLTPRTWSDFEALFGPRGACAGCWCLWCRLPRREFIAQKGEKNRRAMKKLVDSGGVPGIMAYSAGRAIGWCSVSPREEYSVLTRSRVLKPVDDKPVWSVACLFVAKDYRRKGVTTALLKAAATHVRRRGGKLLEGYPIEPKAGSQPDAFLWWGVASSFRKAGFQEIARRSPTRPIMRLPVKD